MLSMLIAFTAAGNVIATQDYMVARDAAGNVVGLIDCEAHELAGGKLRDIWIQDGAAGSGTWPEWLGARAHDFMVELGPDKRIAALVHAKSGHRRERAPLEAEFAKRVAHAADVERVRGSGDPEAIADVGDLVGGPGKPLRLDDQGRTATPVDLPPPPDLPVVGAETFKVR